MGTTHKIQNKKLYQCDPELSKQSMRVHQRPLGEFPLRINNFLLSLPFHRKITAVPFTPVPPCGEQTSIGVIDQNDIGFAACQGTRGPS